jgi:hypothetical protein
MSLALPGAALVVTGVLLCGCGGSTAARPAAPTVLPGDEISTIAPTTSTFPAPSTTSTTSALAAQGRADAVAACGTWQVSDSQDSAQGSGTIRAAAAQATTAAGLDTHWSALAGNMSFVASLAETSNTPADVAQAQTDIGGIQSTCSTFGISLSD